MTTKLNKKERKKRKRYAYRHIRFDRSCRGRRSLALIWKVYGWRLNLTN